MKRLDLINDLNNFKAFNEEEEKDKILIIDFLNKNDDAYVRSNLYAHMTASAWIINKTRDKVLMVYHNIYNSWSWTGGHADGDEDLLNVSIKEVKEETGLNNLELYSKDIFSVETLTVDGHYKKGKYVNSHLHFNVTYLFIADENEAIRPKEDENKAVKWIDVNDVESEVREEWMMQHIYKKLMEKVKCIK